MQEGREGERGAPLIERHAPASVKVGCGLLYLFVFGLLPPIGLGLLSSSIGEAPDARAEEGLACLAGWWIAGLLPTSISAVLALSSPRRRFARWYSLSWALIFVAVALCVALLLLGLGAAHPPDSLGMAAGGSLIFVIPVSLAAAALFALAPATLLSLLRPRSPRAPDAEGDRMG
ncbi:MAG: hypothetical protein OEY14_12390 [Myxococcales bacterium]|nr:hypothetical protein [Myxococcales bacterium]